MNKEVICIDDSEDFIESEDQYGRDKYKGIINGNEYSVIDLDVDDFNYTSFGYYKILDEKGIESWWCSKRFINKKI